MVKDRRSSIDDFPEFYRGFIDNLAVLHAQMVGRVPAEPIDEDIAIKKGYPDLPFLRNDLAEQHGLVRRLMPLRMLMSLFSHRKRSVGKG